MRHSFSPFRTRPLVWRCFLYLIALLINGDSGLAQAPAPELPADPARASLEWDMAASTVVLFNSNSPASGELANYYAKRRKIPATQVIGLACSLEETISRDEFDRTIRTPLRQLFTDRGWWQLDVGASGRPIPGSMKFRIFCPIHGMPLRIAPAVGEPEVGQNVSAASVDSELALLADGSAPIPGPLQNPYYRKSLPLPQMPSLQIFLVGRLDGPSPDVVRSMIDGAIQAEETGLWGKAYIDEAAEDRPGYVIGDKWISGAARAIRASGIPVVKDTHRSRFPLNYPMADAILYFGWYTDHADGPMLDPDFRFRPGAIGCHIHSYSAATLRDPSKHWAGPILAHGAAATLGNVYEPFLSLTTDLETFTARLLEGYSLAEAGWMASPTLSWMTTILGDPLYRPFGGKRGLDSREQDAGYKAYQLGYRAFSGGDPTVLLQKLASAGEAMQSAELLEALGLLCVDWSDQKRATDFFDQATALSPEASDKIRLALHSIDLERHGGRIDNVRGGLQLIVKAFSGLPAAEAAKALLLQIDPPAPALPNVLNPAAGLSPAPPQ